MKKLSALIIALFLAAALLCSCASNSKTDSALGNGNYSG